MCKTLCIVCKIQYIQSSAHDFKIIFFFIVSDDMQLLILMCMEQYQQINLSMYSKLRVYHTFTAVLCCSGLADILLFCVGEAENVLDCIEMSLVVLGVSEEVVDRRLEKLQSNFRIHVVFVALLGLHDATIHGLE